MANEWVKVELYGENSSGQVTSYTIDDSVACSKGAVLQLLSDRKVSYGCLENKPVAGVACEDHIPNKGITKIGVWKTGRFRAVAGHELAVGNYLVASAGNKVAAPHAVDSASSLALIFAISETTAATDATATVVLTCR